MPDLVECRIYDPWEGIGKRNQPELILVGRPLMAQHKERGNLACELVGHLLFWPDGFSLIYCIFYFAMLCSAQMNFINKPTFDLRLAPFVLS